MTKIRWEELDPATFESMVAALLTHTVDGAKRIDRAGRDEGADVVAPMAGGEHVYQVKTFTGRLNSSRRRQILKSLRTARDHRPAMQAWTLVLPTDLTPDERQWFDDVLGREVDVPLTWMGRFQLDKAFAERPDVSRQFLPGSAERFAVDMLNQAELDLARGDHGLGADEAALARIPPRLHAIAFGSPLTGHSHWVQWGLWGQVDSRPVLATGDDDGLVRL